MANYEANAYLDLEPIDLSPEPSRPKKPGRKKDEVWNHFIEDSVRRGGHSSCECVYCGETKDRGRVPDMMAHLALQCEDVEASVKEKYLRILAESNDQSSEKSTAKKRKLDEEIATGI